MTTQAPSPAPGTAAGRRMPLWPLVVAVPLAALAVVQPLAAVVGLLLMALIVAVRAKPVARIAVPFVAATAIAALAGPNLAVPGAPWLFLFRIMIVLLGMAALGYLLMEGRLVASGAIGIPATLLGLLVAWSVISLAWAESLVAGLRWTLFLSMMSGLAIAIPLAFGTRRRAIRLLVVLGCAFALFSLISLLEIVAHVRLPTSRLAGKSADAAFAATSVFGNENNFATYLTLTLPYLLTLPIVFRDVRLRAIGLVGGGAALLALLFTGSKANILSTGLILIGLLLFLGTDVRQRRRVIVAAVIAVLAVLLVVPALQGSGVVKLPERAVNKFSFTILQEQVEQGSGSGAVRSNLLGDGLDLLVETGGMGVGAGNAETHVRSLKDFPGVGNMHNWWLEVSVNLGLVGISLYVCFYLFLLTRQLREARRTEDPLVRYLATAGGVGLIGFVAGSLGPSTMIHFAPMWITFGVGMLTIVLARRAADAGGRLP